MHLNNPEPIAIVGSGCRFPGGASSPSSLWKLLEKPRDVSTEIPDDRFELKGYYHPKGAHHGTTNVQRAYMLQEDFRKFDTGFFNISPNEAESMDPQQRLLMEVVYEALEAGGHTIEGLRGSDTAVFVGTMSVDYNDIVMRDIDTTPTYFATGSSRAILANRISYFFDWHGPSMTIDTACSSSMVALHQCVQSLRTGESRVAVAGGTELLLGPEQFVSESKMNLLSPTGTSRMWDAEANGYARGDGIAAVVLKRLSDAIADGDEIECLIRETGVNQDGKSTGLTVPSSEAQAALIRSTYSRAGLDLSDTRDWPQYFEAHGTGTKVGDPREANAIQTAFNGPAVNGNPLYVGSIKTIIGHTEGTAGLAGVLKAALAIRNGTIPPNMLLNRLNPDVQQYCQNLHVPTDAIPWPSLPAGVPRRASVNSFGFGGTNGHAIVESYQSLTKERAAESAADLAPFTPFTFSAASEESLVALLQSYSEFLKTHNPSYLRDLAWTLQSRRSALPVKTALSASTIEDLASQIDRKLEQAKKSPENKIGVRSRPAKPRLLGVFTGQGAQWATMGAYLIRSSAVVRTKLEELDQALATLPESDRPSWRIADELLAGKDTSRLGEAALSQPLCTAIQVVLVDLLRSAGITFQAVVGHSSGEIAAAYAADFISAKDAVRIAYYRGVHAKHAKGPKGQKGAMLAVGTSWDDAQELLDLPAFKGRAKIAAHNSGASVTLSGDSDGIDHAKRVFDEEKKFARRLIVDTAYHSHHMIPCSDPYVDSLRSCGIKVKSDRDTSCTWYSSVKPGERMEASPDLCDLYWRDNMVNAVLFTEAVQSAATAEELNMAVEVGPHPALKGPATQSLSDIDKSLPYTGVLSRNQNDVEAFSDALGFLWTHLGPGTVDFQAYQSLVSPGPTPKLTVALPSYPWNHSQTNWHESRKAKRTALRGSAFHELLGVPSSNNTDHDLRWTNFLKANEIPWLDGHQLQGQTVFPAAGYVAMALEASQFLAGSRNVQVFEVQDLTIHKAITFDDGASFAVETLVALTGISAGGPNARTQTADFAVYSCPNTGTMSMDLVSSGKVKIFYGNSSFSTLSSSPLDAGEMVEVDSDRFYESLLDLGYGYNGPFKTLTSTKRRFNHASAILSTYNYQDDDQPLIVHPSMLDVAFQASFLAQSAPGDEQLWSLHVPTSIKCIRVNPELCGSLPGSSTQLPLSAVLHEPDGISVRSSIDVFDENGQETLLQVEDLVMKPFSPATASDDRPMFSTTQYGVAMPDGNTAIGYDRPSVEETEAAELCERLAYYYIRKWNSEIAEDEWESSKTDYGYLRNAINQLLMKVDSSQHPSVKEEWTTDTIDRIESLLSRYAENIDIKLIRSIGENMPAVIRGQSTDLNNARQHNMVDQLYSDGLGFSKYNIILAQLTKQITHRYPHIKILELDARAGHATRGILESIGNSFASYSYTDPSPEFVKTAAEEFKIYGQKLTFKVLDPEQTPSSQGFEENSYDVIIASNALHAKSSLESKLANVRRLLRPGGFLLASGITNDQSIRMLTLMGGQTEWLAGSNGGGRKKNSARISTWHNTLRKVGFAGIDTIVPEIDGVAWPFSAIAAQAVDDRINFLRKPLMSPSPECLDELVILGNGTLKTARLAEEISELISPLGTKVTILEGLPTDDDEIPPMSTFINLMDLEEPIFKNLTEDTMEGLKCLFELASNVVWVIEGARTDEPYHNASLGFGRTISAEMSHLSLQFIDSAGAGVSASRLISEAVLRLAALEMWDEKGTLHQEILWSKELELYLENGRLMIPRILPVDDQNARINSLRRPVTKLVDSENAIVCISHGTDAAVVLREECIPPTLEDDMMSVQVSHSVLSAMKVGQETYLFLGLGADRTTGEAVIQLSEINASQTVTSIGQRITIPSGQEPGFLTAVASELLATSLLSALPQSSHVLVHESGLDKAVSMALARQAVVYNISITFSTTKLDKSKSWVQLSPWSSSHMIKESLPVNLTHFVNLATDDEGKRATARIREALPAGCREIDSSDLFRPQSQLQLSSGDNNILATLQEAVNCVQTAIANSPPPHGMVRPSQLSENTVNHNPFTVIDWTSEKTIPVTVQPINAHRLFSRNKTYVLVGLSGALGRSICEWMSQNGAGYICLTSRSCKSDNKWQTAMKKAGTEVRFYTMDVTKKQDLERTVAEIRQTYPPIAGVMNGAAVFHDAAFSEMSLEIMEKVLKPKIDGTRYLDEVFSDSKLDFFIVFSSLTSVVGNSGQSNYTAANAYMTGLVSQRRKRGLAGTSLDIGRLAGIGFVERAGDTVRQQLIRCGFMAISEGDLHQLLAEAIFAGYPGSVTGPILTTGCRTAREDDDVLVPWFNDSRLSHKVVIEARSQDAKAEGMKSNLPVREQLAKVTTKEEALEVLKGCFATKLAMISRLAEGQTVDHNIPLVEYGIDSLVAVEVRGWFLKELKTDMPVLKVLGGGSVAVLCQEALEKLPDTYLPALGTKGSSKPFKVATKVLPISKPPASKVEPVSERSTAPSAGTSSGSRSPIDTPATSISAMPSNLDLAGLSENQKQDVDRVKKPETPYVRKENISFPQSRFWFLRLLIDDQTTFNVAFYYRVTGNLRIGDLERAVRLVTNRHESCRTSFVADETEADLAYQKILPSSLVRLERKKINRFEDVAVEYMAMKATPFDLTSGKLLRLILLSLSATEHYLLFNYHHILMDGVSVQNFLADLEKAYQRQPLGATPYQLPDLSRRQRVAFENGDFDEEVAYWRSEFPHGDHPVLPLLPMAHVSSRIPTKSFEVHQVGCDIEPALMARIREASKASRSTTFHFYLAVFKSMLMRFTDVDDLTIGIADANRTDEDAIGVVGLLLNLLTLRFKRDLAQPFHESVAEARTKTYNALANSRVPFDVLLQELNIRRSSACSPFFQAFFDYRQGTHWKQPFGNTQLELLELSPGRTAYDLTLDITDTQDGARILLRTQAALYDMTAAQLLLNTYVHLLEAFASDTFLKLEDPPLSSDSELRRALDVGRGPTLTTNWPGGTLPHRIEQIAAKNQNSVAVMDGHGNVLTYATMHDRIQAIAEALQTAGVTQGSRVLVFEDATADWPCSMLAIMRIGAIYVPLDLRNPLARLADVAASCKPVAILVDKTTAGDAPQLNIANSQIVDISSVPAKPSSPIPNSARADSIAAILYTSGSTGKPKGIMVKHSGLRNEIEGYTKTWGLQAERVLQQSAFTFNHSSDQMYTGLVNGGSVYIVPWSKRGDPIEITKIIRDEGITYTKATPAEYSLWLDYGRDHLKQASSWHFAFGGGESLTSTLTRSLAALDLPALRFFNSYGPTEISISSTKMEIAYRDPPPQGRIPCGYSLPNYTAYILDEQRKPVPIGMPGELWIGGAGVSLGYLDNQDLTDEHFVPDPYATPEYIAQGWTRMYRTGDIAHLQSDGAMVFHHRVEGDSQVKIRGLRIELGDIESNIVAAAEGALKEAAVTLRDGDPPFLVAHVVFAPHHTISNTTLYLQQLLRKLQVPQYMIPVMAIPLERMPLSNHSKVDRKALKALSLPVISATSSDETSEQLQLSPTMTRLRQIWEEVLKTKELGLKITPNIDFFSIGGNSLLAVRLQSRITYVFNVTLPLVDLLGASTLGEMAQRIEESTSSARQIDWEHEIALPDLTLPGALSSLRSVRSTDKVVLITGAGGFLGKHILQQLVASSEISRIHCIGLRDKPTGKPRELAISSPKIILHRGDLSEQWLGLGEETFMKLVNEVDSILHMAAVRSFWDSYHLLRQSNVLPTKQLIRMAAAHRVPIHYVSTAGVLPQDVPNKAESTSAYPPPVDGSNGYTASRWVSEQVLERAASTLNVPVSIHRFVPGSTTTPVSTVTAALEDFITFVDKMSLMPDFTGIRGHFEILPVEVAANQLATALYDSKAAKILDFYHHECPIRIEIADMQAFLEARRGDKGLPRLPLLKFVGRMKALGLQYFVTSQTLRMEGATEDGGMEILESRR